MLERRRASMTRVVATAIAHALLGGLILFTITYAILSR